MRRVIALFMMLGFLLALPHEGMAKGKKAAAPAPNNKYAAIVIDAATGEVIHQSNANKPLHPASLTKVMTLLLLFDALESGTVRLGDKIPITQNAANQQPSKLGLNPGSSIRVEDAILAVVTKSANDIAVAIGEYLGGSESRFALRMTRRAQDIGMTRTNFVNASGLHNPQQISTARDMATLARYIIVRYPNYYHYFSTKQFTYRGKTHTNHNRLMQTYAGMDGFKTGFVNASGFNLIASAKRGNERLIGVVFGGKSWKSRNDRMAELLDDGFVKTTQVASAGAAKPAAQPVAPAVIASAAPIPPPPQKPILDDVPATVAGADYTSLSALDQGRKVVIGPAGEQVAAYLPQVTDPAPQPDVTEKAVQNVKTAINRGDYSELTGEGDYDAATTRRVETGLMAAAVYKGEHEKVRQMQQIAATQNAAAPAIVPPAGNAYGNPDHVLKVPVAAQSALPPAPVSNLWSVQIGAYTSRVATEDALNLARQKLPATLTHASPIVVPLKTGEGLLFRARLGGFSQQQANEACRYFKDCLPVAPR